MAAGHSQTRRSRAERVRCRGEFERPRIWSAPDRCITAEAIHARCVLPVSDPWHRRRYRGTAVKAWPIVFRLRPVRPRKRRLHDLVHQRYDYPLVIGGKPLFAWEFSVPVMFELTVLFSAFGAVIGMLYLNGLPRYYHPVINYQRFGGPPTTSSF